MMRVRYRVGLGFALGLMVVCLIGNVSADTRTSQLEGGWQIWIDASSFTTRVGEDTLKLGSEEPLAANAPPALGSDPLIAVNLGGYAEYEFESPVSGEAHLYARIMDFRPSGGQSWFLVLNSENHEADGMVLDTPDVWGWQGDRDQNLPNSLSKTSLKQGTNKLRAVPREAEPNKEILLDIIVVSSVPFTPTDDAYNAASVVTAVQPEGKLATVWAALKR